MARVITEPAWSLQVFRLLPGYTPADGTSADTERAGDVVRHTAGELVKECWMEDSLRARHHQRYAQFPELSCAAGVQGAAPT